MILRLKDQFKELSDYKHVMWLMLLSLAVKVLLLGVDQVINPDGVSYIAAAQQLAAGNIHDSLRLYPMPAYPFLLALAHFVIHDWVLAARTIGILSLVLASIPLYGITRILFNRQAAFWSIFFLALTPEANDQALSVLRDPIFLLITLTGIWFFLSGLLERSLNKIMLASLLYIITVLFRVEGVVLIIASMIFFSIKAIQSKDASLKKLACRSLVYWMAALIVIGLIASLIFGPKLMNQNKRVAQLTTEVNKIIHFEAFEKYNKIYEYFKTIENEPPFSGKSKSLVRIVRHWMPLIYFIGLLEYFVKQIFPVFFVPLIWAILSRGYCKPAPKVIEKQYIIVIWIVYILLILYTFMVRDSMQGRFLFTPAVLLYPWVGHGLTLILRWLRRFKYAAVLQIVIILICLITPSVKTIRATVVSDKSILEVGDFVLEDSQLVSAKILFSDARYWLYCKRTDAFAKTLQMSNRISKNLQSGNVQAIEGQAIKNDADALILFINHDGSKNIPMFQHYKIYKRFSTRKGATLIYSR